MEYFCCYCVKGLPFYNRKSTNGSCSGQKWCNYMISEGWTSAGAPLYKTVLSNPSGMLAISELALYQVAMFTLTTWKGIVFKRLEYVNIGKKLMFTNFCPCFDLDFAFLVVVSDLFERQGLQTFSGPVGLKLTPPPPIQIFWPFGSWVFLHITRAPGPFLGSTTVVWPVASIQPLIQLLAWMNSLFFK